MSENRHIPLYLDITGFPGYCIDSGGYVYSTQTNWRGYGVRQMKGCLDSHGYLRVRVTLNGKRRNIKIHRLMARLFLPIQPSKQHEIRHLDGNRQNNCVTNLAWGTRQDNANDREIHGHTSRGLSHSIAIRKGLERKGYNVK